MVKEDPRVVTPEMKFDPKSTRIHSHGRSDFWARFGPGFPRTERVFSARRQSFAAYLFVVGVRGGCLLHDDSRRAEGGFIRLGTVKIVLWGVNAPIKAADFLLPILIIIIHYSG